MAEQRSTMRLYSEFLKANAELFQWSLEIQEIRDGEPGDIDYSFKAYQHWANEVERLTDELNAANFWDENTEEPF